MAEANRACRTAALGGHVKACPEGYVEKVWYNSCGHRANCLLRAVDLREDELASWRIRWWRYQLASDKWPDVGTNGPSGRMLC